jgi:predicted nucleotide-binding protein (sugar kinase/HSP70/actin superfamily)
MDFVNVSGMGLAEFSSMYWGLGAQILRIAKLIGATPRFFGLHLTNFGCGADSFIEHFYKHLMGDKASLILELDEHSAAAGVMTRLEAFQYVIGNGLRNHRLRENAFGRTGQRKPYSTAAAPRETLMALCGKCETIENVERRTS